MRSLPPTSEFLGTAAVLVTAAAAAAIDLRTGRIPNPLTAAAALTGLALAGVGLTVLTLNLAIAGGVLGFALMLPGRLFGATGGGDVKLMAALGTLLGPRHIVIAFLAGAIAGGALALAHAWRRGRVGTTLSRTARFATDPAAAKAAVDAAAPQTRFAYGPALAVGAIFATVWH
jgi:Flp pilus assembly protein protease CpaA